MSGSDLLNPYAAAPAPGAARRGASGHRVRGAVVAVLAGASAVTGSGVAMAHEPGPVGTPGPDDDRSWQCFDAWVVTMDYVPDRVDIHNSNGSITRCEPDRGFDDPDIEDVEFVPDVTTGDLADGGNWACEPTAPRPEAAVRMMSAIVVDDENGVDNICRNQDDLLPLPPDLGEPREPEPSPEPDEGFVPGRGPSGPDDDRGWRCVDVPAVSSRSASDVVVVANDDGSTTRCVTGDDVPDWLEDVPETDFVPGVEVGDLTDDGDWACTPVPEAGGRSAMALTTIMVDDENGNDNLCRHQGDLRPQPPLPVDLGRPDREPGAGRPGDDRSRPEQDGAVRPGLPSPAFGGSG